MHSGGCPPPTRLAQVDRIPGATSCSNVTMQPRYNKKASPELDTASPQKALSELQMFADVSPACAQQGGAPLGNVSGDVLEVDSLPMPSLGSIAHAFGTCHACHYAHSKRGCHFGKMCGLCHYRHPKCTKRERHYRL
mmetsp:Transcript_55737/g.120448  ORF Transcript_55737/g.120448 Transcript_55737/m.120448 type:complete len:137 (+) Transcript_55737:130-540(+)